MPPQFPEEIDVYTDPHNRMKELVYRYNSMVKDADFANNPFEGLLDHLKKGIYQFLSHEKIENKYIMCRLKEKLRAKQIYNSAVCNCHDDDRMAQMLRLVEAGYSVQDANPIDRRDFGVKLRQALNDFTTIFLPHMKEEEEIFQPLLMKYFTYDELKDLKAVVLHQHDIAEKTDSAPEFLLKDLSYIEGARLDDYCSAAKKSARILQQMPNELLQNIFAYLSPFDLGVCAQVCRKWNEVAYIPSLWTSFSPMFWLKGRWKCTPNNLSDSEDEQSSCETTMAWHSWDEDADRDESASSGEDDSATLVSQYQDATFLGSVITGLLPQVGQAVSEINFSKCEVLTNSMFSRILKLCPNVKHLDLSYTRLSDGAFKGLLRSGCPRRLLSIKLRGCSNISSWAVVKMAQCMGLTSTVRYCEQEDLDCSCERQGCLMPSSMKPEQCCLLAQCQYGCSNKRQSESLEELKELCISLRSAQVCAAKMNAHQLKEPAPLQLLDLSGCYQITDLALRVLCDGGGLPHLEYLDLSGCSSISAGALHELVAHCPLLLPENLYYCENIVEGPYAEEANGCQNVCSRRRKCCRSSLLE